MSPPPGNTDLIPALNPPPGVTSNLVNPPSHGYETIIAMTVLLTLSTPIVCIRVWTRHYIHQQLWWDDYATIIALVGLFGLAGLLFETLKYGNGVDLWNVSLTDEIQFLKLFEDIGIVAVISTFFTKLAILLLFLRLFLPPKTQRTKTYYVIWFVIVFNLLYTVALVLLVLLQCVGKGHIPRSQCINQYVVFVVSSVINIITDLVILAIPTVVVWDLQMPVERKLKLSVVFAIGIIAVASSIARLAWQVAKGEDSNSTIVLIGVTLLSAGEQTAGLIVACMPVLPAFFRHVFVEKNKVSSSTPYSSGWKAAFGGHSLTHHKVRPSRGGANDPYLLSAEQTELDDLETGRSATTDSKGITTTIKGGRREMSTLELPLEGIPENPNTKAIVSRSIHIESYPRTIEGDLALQPPAQIRR